MIVINLGYLGDFITIIDIVRIFMGFTYNVLWYLSPLSFPPPVKTVQKIIGFANFREIE